MLSNKSPTIKFGTTFWGGTLYIGNRRKRKKREKDSCELESGELVPLSQEEACATKL